MAIPAQPFGFVAGRWVLSLGDTPDDPDRAPDYKPLPKGKVIFRPVLSHRVVPDHEPGSWAGIINREVTADLGADGQLTDAEGHDFIALSLGRYRVSYEFEGSSWPSHEILVEEGHTLASPLWLPNYSPPPSGPGVTQQVLAVPQGGTAGETLQWVDGALDWVPVPPGPQGPPGEVTTAALTAALAGKVTGAGMTVRVDTTVGTRVLLDHPGGTLMLSGDTGWRNISTSLLNGWAGNSVRLTRTGNTVSLIGRIDGTAKTGDRFFSLPAGFRPPGGLSYSLPGRIAGSALTFVDGGHLETPYAAALGNIFETWTTRDAWPTTLPGQPL